MALALLAACGLSFGAGPADILEIVTPAGKTRLTLDELSSRLEIETVTLQDPVYQREMSYDAFSLTALLHLAGVQPGTAVTSGDEVVFEASDGYAPTASFEQISRFHGYVAFQEHGKEHGYFPGVETGKQTVSPAPFYLVWTEGARIEHEVPWTYQLVRIEIIRFEEKYAAMFPRGATAGSAVMRGFMTFKAECMRCHSVNLQGGDLGPELNAPKNVTEYWSREVLQAFIQDSSSFRYKSKMPPFPYLSGEQIDDILTYLEFMVDRKYTADKN